MSVVRDDGERIAFDFDNCLSSTGKFIPGVDHLHYIDSFFRRLEMLYEEGLGPVLAVIGIGCMILVVINLYSSP